MHSPEKKDSTISAIAEGAILGLSASMFMANPMRSPRLRFFWRRMSPVSSRASNCSLMAAEGSLIESRYATSLLERASSTLLITKTSNVDL
jgi:hypothetical protein